MREIATKVGVQPASLYSHFRSKEDVLWHVCQWTAATATDLMDRIDTRGGSALDRFIAFFHTFVVFHAVNQREALVMATQWRSLGGDRRAFAARYRQLHAERARGYVQGLQEERLIGVRDVEQATRALLDLSIGVSSWYRQAHDGEPAVLADAYVMLALGLLRFDDTKKNQALVNAALSRLSGADPIEVPTRNEMPDAHIPLSPMDA